MAVKSKRHEVIVKMIAAQNIETQEELARALREYGFSVTQATVSRDIKELRLIKVLTPEGRYKYATAERAEADLQERFIQMFENLRPLGRLRRPPDRGQDDYRQRVRRGRGHRFAALAGDPRHHRGGQHRVHRHP